MKKGKGEPIEVFEYNGKKYVLNVHYRLEVAIRTGSELEYVTGAIDIDFGPGGKRCDGFDLDRIKHFVQFRMERYQLFENLGALDEAFNVLIAQGTIKKHPLEPRGHLFYLTRNL
jgi:hypothetical protein